jgi:AcrR family transcriptional regulator
MIVMANSPPSPEPAPAPGPAPDSAAWWLRRQERNPRHRARKDGLTIERIIDAALVIIEEEGPEALTVRRLAQSLGTGSASLYRHVASRAELIALVVDHVLEPLSREQPPPGLDWREQAAWLATRFRDHLREHPAVVPLVARSQLLGPNAMAGRQRVLRGFLSEGFDAESAVLAHRVIVRFILAVLLDARHPAVSAADQRALRDLFASQDAGRLPDIVAQAGVFARYDADAEFAFGLTALLHGIDRLRRPAGEQTARRQEKPPFVRDN